MSFYTSDQVNLDQESFPAFLGQDDAILCDPSSSFTFETIFEPFGSSDSSEYQQTPYNTLREQFPAANVDIAHLDTRREIDHPQSLEPATLQRLIAVEAEIRRSEASRARVSSSSPHFHTLATRRKNAPPLVVLTTRSCRVSHRTPLLPPSPPPFPLFPCLEHAQ